MSCPFRDIEFPWRGMIFPSRKLRFPEGMDSAPEGNLILQEGYMVFLNGQGCHRIYIDFFFFNIRADTKDIIDICGWDKKQGGYTKNEAVKQRFHCMTFLVFYFVKIPLLE